jgi:hypothetical protein
MSSRAPTHYVDRRLSNARRWTLLPLRALWHGIRLPLAAIFGLLEPLVRVLLTLAVVLSVLTALFFEAVSRLPVHSLVALLGFAASCAVLLVLYQRLLVLLSR